MGRAGKVLRLVRVMRILRVFKVSPFNVPVCEVKKANRDCLTKFGAFKIQRPVFVKLYLYHPDALF